MSKAKAPPPELTVTLSRMSVDQLRRHSGTAVNAQSMSNDDRDRLRKAWVFFRDALESQKGDKLRLTNSVDGWVWLCGMAMKISAYEAGAELTPQVSRVRGGE